MVKILISCGGTGGHLFPAISLARGLTARGYSDIIFAVDDSTRTRRSIRDAGYEFVTIDVPKMPYGMSLKWPSFAIRKKLRR